MKDLFLIMCAVLIKLTYSQSDVVVSIYNDKVQLTGVIQMQDVCSFQREGTQTCDCGYRDEEMILPKFSGNIYQVTLINCKILRIPEHAFIDLPKLSLVRIDHIEDLILEQYSLQFSSNRIQLEIRNTVIEEFSSHALSGNIEQIYIYKSRIGVFQPFSVTGISNLLRLRIIDTKIYNIEPQAFKKFSVEEFEIINSTFLSEVPSRSFYEIEVTQNLQLRNSTFTKVHSSAFMLQEVSSLIMVNNRFQQLNGESFQMQIKDSINIRDNKFGFFSDEAFRSISLERQYFSRKSEPIQLNFKLNYMNMINGPGKIIFNEQFNLRISQLYYENLLTCKLTKNLKENIFLKSNADTIYFRMSDQEQLKNDNNENDYLTFSYILYHRCVEQSILIYIIIGVSIGIIVLIILLILIIIICIKRRRTRRLNVIQPDGKTYRETQIVMQIENHGLLKTDL